MQKLNIDEAIVDPKTYADPGLFQQVYTSLRKEDPVHWTKPENYRPFWTITKHADIVEVERQSDKFLNAPRMMLFTHEEEEAIREATGGRTDSHLRTLVNMDNPDHRVFRAMTQSWFMPKNLQKLEKDLGRLAKETVDHMASLNGECDFVNDIAIRYPLRVIMMILGIPSKDEALMLKLTQEIFGTQDPEMRRDKESSDVKATVDDCFAYFTQVIEDRRANPVDDIASVIANAQIDGKPIGLLEAISYYVLVATAGHDTTSSSTSGGMLALIQNPDQLEKLRADPQLLSSAVDEMIRFTTPVKHFFRTAKEDYVLRGRTIRAGDSLMMCYPSANQDEEVFEDPLAFKVDRQPANKHLAFGFGPHVCLGQHLARQEIRALFVELLKRLEHVELAGDPATTRSTFVNGLKRLPIRFRLTPA